MSFAINPSLNHIDIREPYIVEMYRSAKEVLLPGARFRGHPCEAYICISRIEKTMKAYVALLEMELNSVFVYTSDFSTDNSADYPKVVAEANEFASSLGFSMEKVNLDFSTAMREVVIKGIRVMRAPQKKPVLRSMDGYPQLGRTSDPTFPQKPEKSGVSAAQKESLPAELKMLQNRLSAASAHIEKLSGEKLTFEQKAAHEIAALKSALEKAAELKRHSDESFANEIETIKKEKIEAASRMDEALAVTLKAELDSTRCKADLVRKSLDEQIAALQGRIETLESGNVLLEQQLSAEKSSSGEKISRLSSEMESISALLSAEKTAAAGKIAALTLFETSWQEGQQREEGLRRDLELMKEQLNLLEAELATYRQRESNEADLVSRIAALEKEIAASRAEVERLGNTALDRTSVRDELESLAEAKNDLEARYNLLASETVQKEADEAALTLRIAVLEEEIAASRVENERLGNATHDRTAVQAELISLAEAKNDVEAEYIRLANETMQKETEMLDTLYVADAEILRLSREVEIRTQAAAKEKAALEEELKQLRLSASVRITDVAAATAAEASTLAIASPLAVNVAPLQVKPTEPLTESAPVEAEVNIAPTSIPAEEPMLTADSTADDTIDAAVIGDPEITRGLINEFGSFCASSGHSTTEFTIDPTISKVAYSDPAEIVAILRSSNTVQAVPDGSKMQRCEGYVIATKKDGEYRAYVAWYLTESKKVIVCTPEQQPADSRECTQILQDAITYFEIVGFMMELEDLGGTIKSYNKTIRKVPALSRK